MKSKRPLVDPGMIQVLFAFAVAGYLIEEGIGTFLMLLAGGGTLILYFVYVWEWLGDLGDEDPWLLYGLTSVAYGAGAASVLILALEAFSRV